MKFLRSGATAPEAVEAAIKCLEDKEITNAGFGSNLNMDGVVECDATIVDHLGRSGACGAVPGIKNPISLAKVILDTSSQPLSLRRVPPNILVGQGATEFAEEHGIPSTVNEYLVSKNAKDRYLRWNDDLKKADAKLNSAAAFACRYQESEPKRSLTPNDYDKAANQAGLNQGRDHASAILTGTWNEGQPDSPYSGGSPLGENGSPIVTAAPTPPRSAPGPAQRVTTTTTSRATDRSPLNFMTSAFQSRVTQSSSKRPRIRKSLSDNTACLAAKSPSPAGSPHDGSDDFSYFDDRDIYASDLAHDRSKKPKTSKYHKGMPSQDQDTDLVTDTIGAIAIDLNGNIAAGSSSGGIGMKHRGRIGPAALVGIGTAVVPEDPEDDNGTSVAAVTSGTGEHMATSLASAKCAERLFYGTRRGPGGLSIEELDEHNLMEAFILDDFMGHPGVRNQPSTGAIGVMAVKKDRTGIYFYFAHNTDSFALASMSTTERDPACVMSRLGEGRQVTQGARRIRID
ncbi:nucleophile aminohydrolase [Lasiosphaeria miniovina]|uniref:Nucleophile aminohydrolase n=1 Tax=Lasiosphaeria miniovina TaxID=1954250 RepID=A0AA39ZZG8_9PEZI|nr:nucleophile aminohydrolase [Lasiosphaeria miniovina]KAK0706513.1 nucleophile aminohydrolase [Lasiosphaeria miniovina]